MNTQPLYRSQDERISPTPLQFVGIPSNRHAREMICNTRITEIPYAEAIRQFQRRYILHLLAKHRCHLGKSAEALNMHRNTLTRTLTALNLDIVKIRSDMRRRVLSTNSGGLHSLTPRTTNSGPRVSA